MGVGVGGGSAGGFLLIACTFPSSSSSIKARPPSHFQVCSSPHSLLLYVAPACPPPRNISRCLFNTPHPPPAQLHRQFPPNRCETASERERKCREGLDYCTSVRLSASSFLRSLYVCTVNIPPSCSCLQLHTEHQTLFSAKYPDLLVRGAPMRIKALTSAVSAPCPVHCCLFA